MSDKHTCKHVTFPRCNDIKYHESDIFSTLLHQHQLRLFNKITHVPLTQRTDLTYLTHKTLSSEIIHGLHIHLMYIYLYHANKLIFREYSVKSDNSTRFPVMEMSARAYLWCEWQQEIFYWENIRLKSTEAPPPSNTTASQYSYWHITIHTQLQIWQDILSNKHHVDMINITPL